MQMQSTPIAVFMPKSDSGASAVAVGNEVAITEAVNFSALLLAHIKSGQAENAEAGTHLGVEDELLDTEVLQDAKSQPGLDLSLPVLDPSQSGLVSLASVLALLPMDAALKQAEPIPPSLANAMESDIPVLGPVFSKLDVLPILSSGAEVFKSDFALDLSKRAAEFPVNGKLLPQNESDVLPILSSGAEVFKSDFSLDLSKRAAEFAVDDKLLPQEESWKAAKTLDFGMLSSESQRLLDHSPNVMPPVAASVGQVVATDVKTAPVVTSVQVPVGSVGWGESLGQKVLWMAGQQTHVAELRLDPPHLGPMEVRLTVSNDQVTAIFISHQPAVRDALEAAMPRLREMFAESGMLLGDAMVSSDSLPQQQSSGREGRSASSAHVVDDGPQSWSAGGMISLSRDGRGMVDLFA